MSKSSLPGASWRRWPLLLVGLPAAVSTWTGWVGLGVMSGYGLVHPLPGIRDDWQLNTAITLPVGVETYSAMALGVWLSRLQLSRRTRRFAAVSALTALGVGVLGQVIYHLLTALGYQRAPVGVVVFVACLPMLALGAAAALYHLLRADQAQAGDHQTAEVDAEPDQLANTIAENEPAAAPAFEVAHSEEREIGATNTAEPDDDDAGDQLITPVVSEEVLTELHACETKAEQLGVAWRELGVQGVPQTTDVIPAVAWLAERGFRVERSRAYGVRRELEEKARAAQARAEQRLALVGGGR